MASDESSSASGTGPQRHRSLVRDLLGLPPEDGVPISFAAAPAAGLPYLRPYGGAARPEPATGLEDAAHVLAARRAPAGPRSGRTAATATELPGIAAAPAGVAHPPGTALPRRAPHRSDGTPDNGMRARDRGDDADQARSGDTSYDARARPGPGGHDDGAREPGRPADGGAAPSGCTADAAEVLSVSAADEDGVRWSSRRAGQARAAEDRGHADTTGRTPKAIIVTADPAEAAPLTGYPPGRDYANAAPAGPVPGTADAEQGRDRTPEMAGPGPTGSADRGRVEGTGIPGRDEERAAHAGGTGLPGRTTVVGEPAPAGALRQEPSPWTWSVPVEIAVPGTSEPQVWATSDTGAEESIPAAGTEREDAPSGPPEGPRPVAAPAPAARRPVAAGPSAPAAYWERRGLGRWRGRVLR
jgi:hypothetical protein